MLHDRRTAAAAGLATLVVALGLVVSGAAAVGVERAATRGARRLPDALATALEVPMALGTRLGALAGALAVGLLVERRAGWRAAAAIASAWAASTLLKAAFARPRLSAAALGATPREVTHSFAYPSSHAALAFALAASLSLARPRAAPAALGLALVVALARMVAGVHTPLDLVGGAALGAAAALLVAVADDALVRRGRRPTG